LTKSNPIVIPESRRDIRDLAIKNKFILNFRNEYFNGWAPDILAEFWGDEEG
jgi:hypothetical protein